MGTAQRHQQVILWKLWNKACSGLLLSAVCLVCVILTGCHLQILHGSHATGTFPGVFPVTQRRGTLFPLCLRWAISGALAVFHLFSVWKVKLSLHTVWIYLFLSSPVLLSQCPASSSSISIYTSTSKQTITHGGPPQPPTSSHKNSAKQRLMEDWEGVGALGGNKSPDNADIMRGTER